MRNPKLVLVLKLDSNSKNASVGPLCNPWPTQSYWTTEIYRTVEGFCPSLSSFLVLVPTMADHRYRQYVPRDQYHHHGRYNIQRRTNTHKLLSLHQQYSFSTNNKIFNQLLFFSNFPSQSFSSLPVPSLNPRQRRRPGCRARRRDSARPTGV